MLSDKKDVGFLEDASFVLQNMIALEHHAEMSFISNKDEMFQRIADGVRRDRSKILYEMLKNPKSQEYCMSKHDLAIAQGLKELAKRKMEIGEAEQSKEYYEMAGRYEAIFRFLYSFSNGEIKENDESLFSRLLKKIKGDL
jgi:hypothetical protein